MPSSSRKKFNFTEDKLKVRKNPFINEKVPGCWALRADPSASRRVFCHVWRFHTVQATLATRSGGKARALPRFLC